MKANFLKIKFHQKNRRSGDIGALSKLRLRRFWGLFWPFFDPFLHGEKSEKERSFCSAFFRSST